jgi:G:T-mismatch repair DNA endonuclease (very short patch repair protein)
VSDEANKKRGETQKGKPKNWTPEGRAKLEAIWASKRGVPLTDETKRKLSEKAKENWQDPEIRQRYCDGITKHRQENPGYMRERALRGILSQQKSKGPTSIERALCAALDELGIVYIFQHPMFDKFVVDAYLPNRKTVIETNGTYWHADPLIYNPDGEKMSKRQQLRVAQDASKAAYLKRKGYKLIVLWERDKDRYIDLLKSELDL